MKIFYYILILLFICFSCRKPIDNNNDSNPENIFENNTGNFEFSSYESLSDKPFNVHYYFPNNIDRSSAPIIFIFPGMNRDAFNYLSFWMPLADAKNIMVFAFEFNNYHYPGGNSYQQGYIFDDNGILNPKDKWTFSLIEPVFDLIKTQLDYSHNFYDVFGHSGGGQFVHRFIEFVPNSRVNRAVAANSGWYTMPDTTVSFPYGFGGTNSSQLDIQNTFSKNLQIHLGTNDNNPNDPSLRKTPEANIQGAHRLERGRYFISKSDSISNSYNFSFNWLKVEVPNVAHNGQLMSNFAADQLY
ncbi:hypothetical protein OA958_02340 [Bacteroidota bacterium]|nr:hypothetical protein [Bacteroidota bacterium]|tara:strand:- start:809 stop:1708 length:900 start_codon:yes stop_codon:yes gene_type:complete